MATVCLGSISLLLTAGRLSRKKAKASMELSSSLPLSQYARASTISSPTWRNHFSMSFVVAAGQKNWPWGAQTQASVHLPIPFAFQHPSLFSITLICLPALALLLLRTRIPSGHWYLRPSVSLPHWSLHRRRKRYIYLSINKHLSFLMSPDRKGKHNLPFRNWKSE